MSKLEDANEMNGSESQLLIDEIYRLSAGACPWFRTLIPMDWASSEKQSCVMLIGSAGVGKSVPTGERYVVAEPSFGRTDDKAVPVLRFTDSGESTTCEMVINFLKAMT